MDFLLSLFRRKYRYSNLPPGFSFRYLVLKPGQGEETLECTTHIHSLDEPPEYEAVSYVWGQNTRDQTIICNGCVLKITPNLFQVLKRLRWRTEPRVLWTDSICINQEDRAEKAQQVMCMAQIYRSAKRTLVYLGEEEDAIVKDAFKFVDEINRRILEKCQTDKGPWMFYPYLEPEDPILHDPRWASLSVLYSSVWFQRGWTVQEAALPQESLAIWGAHEISWSKLMRVDIWTCSRAPLCALARKFSTNALHWHNYFGRHQHEAKFFWVDERPPTMGLLPTLESSRSLGVTDPRDRVYAFLGLFASTEDDDAVIHSRIRPDYNQCFLAVYKDFSILYIESKRNIELLNYVYHTPETLGTSLPSWVPRWDITPKYGSRLYIPLWPSLKDRSSSIHDPYFHGVNLSVRAVVFDEITYISEVLHVSKLSPEDMANNWNAIFKRDTPTLYPQGYRLHAFIETLYSDMLVGDSKHFHKSQSAYLLDVHHYTNRSEAINEQYWRDVAEDGDMELFHTLTKWRLQGKRIFLTMRGYIGTADEVIQTGDRCGIIFGCKMPVILRGTGAEREYRLLGGAYITGAKLQASKDNFQRFTLLGRDESKDWVEWDVQEENIVLC